LTSKLGRLNEDVLEFNDWHGRSPWIDEIPSEGVKI
jgi:hypothetical protein